MSPQVHPTTALCDVGARPRTGLIMQAIALLLTASPVLAVALWSMTAVM